MHKAMETAIRGRHTPTDTCTLHLFILEQKHYGTQLRLRAREARRLPQVTRKMHFCFRERVHHKMERAAADGGGGAVYPHGALHAPVRAPDGELGDGSRYPRGPCSSRTFCRALNSSV